MDIGFPTTPGTSGRAPAATGTTYLITGGAGFIGSHLTEALLARGDRAIVLDDLSTGSMKNLAGMALHPGLLMVTGSIRDELVVDELMHTCDAVVHLAAAVGVRLIIDEPLRSFTTNLRGSEVVIGAAHRYQRPILIASTSEIYGKNGHAALTETADRILGPTTVARWAYSTAKAVDEILAMTYHRERGLPAVVTRLFNTVGPRQSAAYGMVIPTLVKQALLGQPAHRIRGWTTEPLLLPRGGHRRLPSYEYSTTDGPWAPYSTSDRPRRSPSSNWPRPSWRRRARARGSSWCPTTRHTKRGLRTCAAACLTSRRSRR